MDCHPMNRRYRLPAQATACLLVVLLSACDEPPPPAATLHITSRPVATTYKIKPAEAAQTVACYLIQNDQLKPLTVLPRDDLVDIVAIEEGLRPHQGDLWLHIYPRLTHRPSCYVNVNNLIPYS